MAAHGTALLLLTFLGCVESSRILPSGAQRRTPVVQRHVNVKTNAIGKQRPAHPAGPPAAQSAVQSAVQPAEQTAAQSAKPAAKPAVQSAARSAAKPAAQSTSHFATVLDARPFGAASLAEAETSNSSRFQPSSNGWLSKGLAETDPKINRNLIVAGIGAGLVLLLCCGCCLMDRFMRPTYHKNSAMKKTGSGSKKTLSGFDEMPGDRKQHLHNGHVIYEWDQTPGVATLYTKVPEGLTKHDLDIKISARRLQVGRKGKPPFMKEDTYEEVSEEDSAWRLRSNGELQIYLQKVRKADWPCVLLHKRQSQAPAAHDDGKPSFGGSWLQKK